MRNHHHEAVFQRGSFPCSGHRRLCRSLGFVAVGVFRRVGPRRIAFASRQVAVSPPCVRHPNGEQGGGLQHLTARLFSAAGLRFWLLVWHGLRASIRGASLDVRRIHVASDAPCGRCVKGVFIPRLPPCIASITSDRTPHDPKEMRETVVSQSAQAPPNKSDAGQRLIDLLFCLHSFYFAVA